MKSMTGFGAGESALGSGKVVVEVRTVNHRYLDVRVRLPKELGDHMMLVEQVLRARLSRGRCDVCVRLEGAALAPPRFDRARAAAALQAFAELRDEHFPGAEVPMSLLAAVPDLFSSGQEQEHPRQRGALEAAVRSALDDLDVMRQREGEALGRDLEERAALLQEIFGVIEARQPAMQAAHRRRLHERVSALLAASEAQLDLSRIDQELVLYADRTDISEELTRLRIHIEAIGELLASSEPSGRKLDFLLQEVGREINTIGSKSQDASIARAVVDGKAELERLREQVQNVE
jgi:uncharacterized protein (TIGR00255 family)